MLLSIGLGACAVIGFVSYETGRVALNERIVDQLASIRTAKQFEVQSYFRRLENQVRTLSEDLMVIEAMKEFNFAFHKLNNSEIPLDWQHEIENYYSTSFMPSLEENMKISGPAKQFFPVAPAARYLQYHYLVRNPNRQDQRRLLVDAEDGSDYTKVHTIYHPLLSKYVEKFGYTDLLLVDDETGDVVYTVQKRSDFTSNVASGAFKNTNFSRAVEASREGEKIEFVKLVDFQPYLAANGRPVAFIASPIYDRLKHVGDLVLAMPVDEVNSIMTDGQNWKDHGLGNTGENYLVGPDYLMRSDSRALIENQGRYVDELRSRGVPKDTVDVIQRLRTSILLHPARTKAVEAALQGRTGTIVGEDSLGIRSLMSYQPLNVEGLKWVLVSEIDQAEALGPIRSLHVTLIAWTLVISVLVGGLALLLTEAFLRPIRALTDGARRFGAGEQNVKVRVDRTDEFGILAGTFNEMIGSISEKTRIIEQKNAENERLLLNILPSPIATRLKNGENSIADGFAEASVLFGDLVGFTSFSANISAEQLVLFLNDLFSRFDHAALARGIEKIKTIGDCYMAVGGIPSPFQKHGYAIIELGLDMIRILGEFNQQRGTHLQMRIGIHCGPVVAGVIGSTKFIYDLWGDTVNLASRMESTGVPGSIQVTRAIFELVNDQYDFEERGLIEVKGKGKLPTWLLKGKRMRVEASEMAAV